MGKLANERSVPDGEVTTFMTQTGPHPGNWALNDAMRWVLLYINAFLILTPKLILIKFNNDTLWGDIGWTNFLGALTQDMLVVIIVTAAVALIIRQATCKRLATAAIISGSVLLLLLFDMRVRQLWLRPLDITLLRFGFENASGLLSGSDLFFKYYAGLDMTFRRLLLLACFAHILIWFLISWLVLTPLQFGEEKVPNGRVVKGLIAVPASVACVSLLIAVTSPGYRYRMNENILVGSLLDAVRSVSYPTRNDQAELLAATFEQRAAPLYRQLKLERTILRDQQPFKNVVVVVLESVRWRGLHLDNSRETRAPTLARMAAQGIVSKSYVSVPHSSKAYFAILSGRHPYPGVETREVLRMHHESILHQFMKVRKGTTLAFSSLFLGFENVGGLVQSLGIAQRFETTDLAATAGAAVAKSGGYGSSDELLYGLGVQHLRQAPQPFAAFFFPIGAHYPYDCPLGDEPSPAKKGPISAFARPTAGSPTHANYVACVQYTDMLLAGMIDEFRRHDLLKDTLFVFVGDHGESFGEHGLFAHNSSMYEEEVTVPLVFWSDDGRLAHHVIPTSQQIDIAPTIADLMGMMNSEVPVQGVSLLRRSGRVPPMFMATFFEGVGLALIEDSLKYIWEPRADQLFAFDLKADPNETSAKMITGESKLVVVQRLRAFKAYQELTFPR